MATTTISISEKAYQRLRRLRRHEAESFTQVILRMTSATVLDKYVGIISKVRGTEMKKQIQQSRRENRVERAKRRRRHGLS